MLSRAAAPHSQHHCARRVPQSWPLEHPSPPCHHLSLPRCLRAEEHGKFTQAQLDFSDFAYSFGRLDGQSHCWCQKTTETHGLHYQHADCQRHLWGCELRTPTSPASFQLHGQTVIPLPSPSKPPEQGRQQMKAEGGSQPCSKLSPSSTCSFPPPTPPHRLRKVSTQAKPRASEHGMEVINEGPGLLRQDCHAPRAGGEQHRHTLPTSHSSSGLLATSN